MEHLYLSAEEFEIANMLQQALRWRQVLSPLTIAETLKHLQSLATLNKRHRPNDLLSPDHGLSFRFLLCLLKIPQSILYWQDKLKHFLWSFCIFILSVCIRSPLIHGCLTKLDENTLLGTHLRVFSFKIRKQVFVFF